MDNKKEGPRGPHRNPTKRKTEVIHEFDDQDVERDAYSDFEGRRVARYNFFQPGRPADESVRVYHGPWRW